MKKRASQLGKLILLSVLPLVALSPALALANYHACSHAGPAHCLKAQPCGKFFPESGLRAGRLSSTYPLRSISKRSPEVTDYTPRIFRTKNTIRFTSPAPTLLTAAYPPRNFLVLRI